MNGIGNQAVSRLYGKGFNPQIIYYSQAILDKMLQMGILKSIHHPIKKYHWLLIVLDEYGLHQVKLFIPYTNEF